MKPHSQQKRDKRLFRANSLVLLSLITYGSLYPFEWNFTNRHHLIFRGPFGLIDAFENIILFFPLGCYWAWNFSKQFRKLAYATVFFFLAFFVSVILQWLQTYLPRVPQLSDVLFNVIGYITGWAAGMITTHWVERLAKSQSLNTARMDKFCIVMLVIWGFAELYPFVPTLDVSSLFAKLKIFIHQDIFEVRRASLHFGMTVIGLDMLRVFLQQSFDKFDKSPLIYFSVVAIFMAGKFLIVEQTPGPSIIVGMTVGTLFFFVLELTSDKLRSFSLIAIAALTYFSYSLFPFDWSWTPKPMKWLPFSSSLSNSIGSVIRNFSFESLCFGSILWNAVRTGSLLKGITVVAMVIVFACEYLQKFMPTRTPETTSVVLVVLVSWLISNSGRSGVAEKPHLSRTH